MTHRFFTPLPPAPAPPASVGARAALGVRTVVWAVLACAVTMLGASASIAQTPATTPRSCAAALDEAGRLYVEQAYNAAESVALECVYLPSATPSEVEQAHRLMALTFLKRDLVAEARLTVIKILGANYGYQADPTTDLPVYVALVDAVRGQLRVAPPALSEPTATAAPVAAPAAAPVAAPAEAGPVNVNTATVEALDTVPGIGPALASRIVAHREQYGPFRSVADVQQVRGIGPRSIERMAPSLTVTGGVAAAPAAAVPSAPTRPEAQARRVQATVPVPLNLNTATAEQLESLPGIGPALAGRILAFRADYGPFRSAEDVMRVRGIGERTYEALADLITAH